VLLTRGSCEQAGRQMRRGAGMVGLERAQDKVGVVDGAEWIRKQIEAQSLPLDAIELDFYHFAENVHKARRAVYGEEDPKDAQAPGNAWGGEILHPGKRESHGKLEEAVRDGALSRRKGSAEREAALG